MSLQSGSGLRCDRCSMTARIDIIDYISKGRRVEWLNNLNPSHKSNVLIGILTRQFDCGHIALNCFEIIFSVYFPNSPLYGRLEQMALFLLRLSESKQSDNFNNVLYDMNDIW